MTGKGQIVEIPEASDVYEDKSTFLSKQEELSAKSKKKQYSLFDGFLIGGHSGVGNFKIGQRKGINAGGKSKPLYVIGKDEIHNRLFVGAGDSHPGLFTRVLSFTDNIIHWLIPFPDKILEQGIYVNVFSLMNEKENPAVLYGFDKDVFIEFDAPVLMVTKNYPLEIRYQNNIIAKIN